MKAKLLDWLCCPACRGTLTLKVFVELSEVEEGVLTCAGCERIYPVINGIPRMLPDQLTHLVVEYHQRFFRHYASLLRSYLSRCGRAPRDAWWRAESRTVKSYSYQWRTFKEMRPHWERIFRDSIHPITPSFFRGKVGLDAGCGFGRSLYYAASYGAEVIGMDLSEAVEAARENVGRFRCVHLVQGDIFHPPFRERSFEFVYSIGVLQHLPDPRGGLLSLSTLVAPDQPIFVWMYSRGRGRQIAFVTALRSISTRLPYRLLHALCAMFAAIQWVCWIMPYKLLSAFRATRRLAQRIPFTFHARYPFRVLHTDWFDSLSVPLQGYFRREDVAAWFREGGLDRITMDAEWGKVAGGGRGLGYVPAPVKVEQVA